MARATTLRLLASVVAGLLTVSGVLAPTRSVSAQTATTIIQLESPGGSAPVGTRFMVNGWAADPTGQGTGVDIVQIYLGDPQDGGQDVGQASYGQPRPDVARTLGDQRFTNSGFQLALEVPPGQYTLYVYAHLNTAGPDEGWASFSQSFTASASARSDPQAIAALNGDQPQVRSAAPAPAGPTSSGGTSSRGGSGAFTATVDASGAIRTSGSTNDPIPLDPIVPGMSSVQTQGRPELADPTGSGMGIRQSVISEGLSQGTNGQYRTGQVTMTGGGGNQCPGPSCPANTSNVNTQLQQMPSDLIRQLTGYNIPGLGTNIPCTPSNGPGGCNPQTGSSAAPGAPTGTQILQQQAQAALQSGGGPVAQPAVNTGPPCSQSANGQCIQQQGAQGPLGSTCLRFVGSQCAYYGAAPPTAPAQAQAPLQSAVNGQAGGCAQWSGTGQCLTPAASAASLAGAAGAPRDGFIPGLATTYPAGVLSAPGGASPSTSTGSLTSPSSLTSPTSMPVGTTTGTQAVPGQNAAVAAAPAGYAGAQVPSTSGVCLQFSPSGSCTQYR